MDASAVSQDNIETFSNAEARAVIEKEPHFGRVSWSFMYVPCESKTTIQNTYCSPLKSVEYKSLST